MEAVYKETVEEFKEFLRENGEHPEDYTEAELYHMLEAGV